MRLNIVATWDRFRLCCFSSGGRNRAPHSAAGREVTRSRDVNDRTCTGSILSRLSGSGDGRCALSPTGYRNWHRAGSARSCSASCTRCLRVAANRVTIRAPSASLGAGAIARLLPAFAPSGIGECRDLMGAGALRNSVREGRDAGMGRFQCFLALFGCTSRVLWLSYWAPHLLLPEVEPVRRLLEPRIEPLHEPPGATLLLPDSRTPSAALRYWNMARQRYCRRLARYQNT